MREMDRQGEGPGTGAKRFLGRSGSAARLARLAILLEPSGAQSGKTVRFELALPGVDLFLRKLIPLARFLEGDLPGLDGRYQRSPAAGYPSLGFLWIKQIKRHSWAFESVGGLSVLARPAAMK